MAAPSAQRPGPSAASPAPRAQRPAPGARRPGPSAPGPAPRAQAQRPGPRAAGPAPRAQHPAPRAQRHGPSAQRPGPSAQRPGPSATGPASRAPGPAPRSQRHGPSAPGPGPSAPGPAPRALLNMAGGLETASPHRMQRLSCLWAFLARADQRAVGNHIGQALTRRTDSSVVGDHDRQRHSFGIPPNPGGGFRPAIEAVVRNPPSTGRWGEIHLPRGLRPAFEAVVRAPRGRHVRHWAACPCHHVLHHSPP